MEQTPLLQDSKSLKRSDIILSFSDGVFKYREWNFFHWLDDSECKFFILEPFKCNTSLCYIKKKYDNRNIDKFGQKCVVMEICLVK